MGTRDIHFVSQCAYYIPIVLTFVPAILESQWDCVSTPGNFIFMAVGNVNSSLVLQCFSAIPVDYYSLTIHCSLLSDEKRTQYNY